MEESDKLKESLAEEKALGREYAEEVAKWAEVAQKESIQLRDLKELYAQAVRKNNKLVDILREHNLYYDSERMKEREKGEAFRRSSYCDEEDY